MKNLNDAGLAALYEATENDRAHFCSSETARASIPEVQLANRPEGYQHIALNVSTGHGIPCADAFIASGYVVGSSRQNPYWVYAVQTGPLCQVWESDRWKSLETINLTHESRYVGLVLQDVAGERKRQDGKWGGANHDDHHSVADFVQLICDYSGWARVMSGMGSADKARRRLVQVAALAVASIESIDRKMKDSQQ